MPPQSRVKLSRCFLLQFFSLPALHRVRTAHAIFKDIRCLLEGTTASKIPSLQHWPHCPFSPCANRFYTLITHLLLLRWVPVSCLVSLLTPVSRGLRFPMNAHFQRYPESLSAPTTTQSGGKLRLATSYLAGICILYCLIPSSLEFYHQGCHPTIASRFNMPKSACRRTKRRGGNNETVFGHEA